MPAVDRKSVVDFGLAHQSIEQAAGGDPDVVSDRKPRLPHVVINAARDFLR